MAWYRAGGGGIPSSLKTGMNSVLNKKFGTSTTYDPAGWPDDVNLLGKLPEKTASGSIAHITDGADEVPIKSWEVEIAPTLTGKSAIECAVVDGEEYLYGATVVQGGFNINNGNNYPSANRLRTDNYIPITSGSYTIENNQSYEYVVYVYDETNAFIDAESLKTWQTYGTVFSISGNRHIRIGWRKSDNSTITADEITGYHCYAVGSKTVSTVNLGRTIYGGTADVVNGTGTETHGLITDFSTLRSNGTSSTGAYRYIMDVSGMGDYNVGACVSNLLNYRVSYNANVGEFYNTSNVLIVFLSQDNETDARTYLANNSCKVAYPFVTPSTFTFDGITPTLETALGVNNFWADTGDSSVTYRADIDLLLGGN